MHHQLLRPCSHLIDSSQIIANSEATDAWGNVVASSAAVVDRYGYTQREKDTESSLMHYRARSYDPRLGRFVQMDPPIRRRPISHYLYAGLSPLTNRDPRGTQEDKPKPQADPINVSIRGVRLEGDLRNAGFAVQLERDALFNMPAGTQLIMTVQESTVVEFEASGRREGRSFLAAVGEAWHPRHARSITTESVKYENLEALARQEGKSIAGITTIIEINTFLGATDLRAAEYDKRDDLDNAFALFYQKERQSLFTSRPASAEPQRTRDEGAAKGSIARITPGSQHESSRVRLAYLYAWNPSDRKQSLVVLRVANDRKLADEIRDILREPKIHKDKILLSQEGPLQ